mmetsp:Transcript_8744/g.21247  ORF Transcript_8744/g.21247 Transcript_8744/m.21247 type:complete len:237 (+) Transcript_8744:1560-2270(+)
MARVQRVHAPGEHPRLLVQHLAVPERRRVRQLLRRQDGRQRQVRLVPGLLRFHEPVPPRAGEVVAVLREVAEVGWEMREADVVQRVLLVRVREPPLPDVVGRPQRQIAGVERELRVAVHVELVDVVREAPLALDGGGDAAPKVALLQRVDVGLADLGSAQAHGVLFRGAAKHFQVLLEVLEIVEASGWCCCRCWCSCPTAFTRCCFCCCSPRRTRVRCWIKQTHQLPDGGWELARE